MNDSINVDKIRIDAEKILGTNEPAVAKLLAIASLLKQRVRHYNWVGFYILDKESNLLELGPYVGASTDHTRIPVGKGVCGQVAESNQTMVVQDVSQMENYLSCSIDVKSEVVIPIRKDGEFVAQLDIDSHFSSPFTQDDLQLLEDICDKLSVLF